VRSLLQNMCVLLAALEAGCWVAKPKKFNDLLSTVTCPQEPHCSVVTGLSPDAIYHAS
jgi:hypothetical protein